LEASYGKLCDVSLTPVIVIKPVFTPPIVVPDGNASEPLSLADKDADGPKYNVLDDIRNVLTYISLNPRSTDPMLTFE
jgi:hypothetical protein